MRGLPFRFFVLPILACVSLGPAATPSLKAGGVTLRYKFAKGDKFRYSQTMVYRQGRQIGDSSVKHSISTTVEVTALNAGSFKTRTTITGAQFLSASTPELAESGRLNAQSVKGRTEERVCDRLGRPSGGIGKFADPIGVVTSGTMGAFGVGMMGVVFPEKAVVVGSSWDYTIDLKKMMEATGSSAKVKTGGEFVLRYKLKGLKTAGGKTTATIGFTLTGKTVLAMPNGPQGKPADMSLEVDGSGTIKLDASTGSMVELTGATNSKLETAGIDFAQRVTTTVRRMPAAG